MTDDDINPKARKRQAFTIFEWAAFAFVGVVVFLLLFPAFNARRDGQPRSPVKNDVVQIVNAVKGYYTEYGHYPFAGERSDDDITFARDKAELLNVLRATPDSLEEHNPRRIVFLEMTDAKKGRSGLTSDGTFVDPWGRPYQIRIDANHDEEVANPMPESPPGPALRTSVIAWSWGSDGKPGETLKRASADVGSWK